MKRLKFILLFLCLMFFTAEYANAQNIGGSYYLTSTVDGNGRQINNNIKRISVVLLQGFGNPMLTVIEYTSLPNGQELTMGSSLSGNESLQYAGMNNGWNVFTFHGLSNVYIQGNTIRVEKRIGNLYSLAEYRK